MDQNNNTFQTFMPTKNKPALYSYYFGIAGLLPFVGLPFAIAAIVLGAMGLKKYNVQPTPGAKGHAIAGLCLGIFEVVCVLLFVLFIVVAANSSTSP